MVKFCSHPDLAAHYTIMLPVVHEFGVCRSRTTEITVLFSQEGELLPEERVPDPGGHVFEREYYLMLPAPDAQGCPSPDDPKYIWVDGASPGVFRLVMEAWETLLSSADPANHVQLKPNDPFSPDASSEFLEALAAYPDTPPPIDAFRYQPLFWADLEYQLQVSHRRNGGFGWVLYFEFTEGGIKTVRVGSWIA